MGDSFKTKKYYGQHFLKSEALAEKIVALLPAEREQEVIEIGPGKGVLTRGLMQRYPRLRVVEIDGDAVQFLQRKLALSGPQIIHTDVLKWDMSQVVEKDSYFIGNLPYNISSPIFFKLLEQREKMQAGVFMVQKEVADRICADSGNKTYGILSVLLGAYYEVRYALTVPPGAFAPPPKVMSAVIVLDRRPDPPAVEYQVLKAVVKAAFNQRRKTLRNALKSVSFPWDEKHEAWMALRAEQLPVEAFIELAQSWKSL